MKGKVIANIINAGLILALSSAFPNTYEITHFSFMRTAFNDSFNSRTFIIYYVSVFGLRKNIL